MDPKTIRRNPFVAPRIPVALAHTDIEAWTEAAKKAFEPFVRRRSILLTRRDIFRTELVNLLPILDHPMSVKALTEAVRMCRRAIYTDSVGAHAHQIARFQETSQADQRWLNLAAATTLLDNGADLADRAAQVMGLIDGTAEGCLKPRVKYLFGFAHRLSRGTFPQRDHDFGSCISEWPNGVAGSLKSLMTDPVFGVPVSQWRNIAAHGSYTRVGRDEFEAEYGRNVRTTINFSFEQLENTFDWVKSLVSICRMANVIVDIEFMPELHRSGLKTVPNRIDAFLIILSHNLRMVGFTYFGEVREESRLAVYFLDDLERVSLDAIIHASQVLDQLALASTSDVSLRGTVTEVEIGLVNRDGETYASAKVDVNVALQGLDRKISMKKYIDQIRFWFESNIERG